MVFMMKDNIFADVVEAYKLHSRIFYGQEIDLNKFEKIYNLTCQRYLYCLAKKNHKHFPKNLLKHADEYTSFLVFLAREAYKNKLQEVAESAYLINRRMNSFDCFYTREMPDIFHLEHPVGSIIGQAKMKNFLVIYQGVNIGGNLKHDYPSINEGVVLFPRSSILGSCNICSNSAIGAGVQIYNENIQKNSAVSLRNREGLIISPIKWNVKDRFFSKL